MDSEILLKFIGYFPDHLSALLRTLFRTTFVKIAVFSADTIELSDRIAKGTTRGVVNIELTFFTRVRKDDWLRSP